MTNIDFYILQETTLAARDHFACRLAEKAIHMGHHVVISVTDQAHAESLSQYLWSFKPESFVPHHFSSSEDETQGSENAMPDKVIIDWQDKAQAYHDIIINLKHEIPKQFSQFQKLSEIVVQDETLLPITRSHFTFYRDRGYPLKSHKINSKN